MFTLQFWADLAERALATFVQAFVAALLVVPGADLTDGGLLRTAAAGGIAAGLSAVKSVLASRVGDRDSAALLPAVEAR